MGTRLWLCEKQAQAKDIASVLDAAAIRRNGFFETRVGVITWASGHLLEQASPDHYLGTDVWCLDALPVVPTKWVMQPRKSKSATSQLAVIKACLAAAAEVVIATDADREGEMIARELIEAFRYNGPIMRLWLSSLDERSIRAAVARLREGSSTEPLYWAAQARSRADWLIGLNLTRAATLAAKQHGGRDLLSIGRVQTPTLALVVRRDREIEAHVQRDFYELAATVASDAATVVLRHAPPASPEDRRIYERERAEALADRAKGAVGPLVVRTETKHQGPPKLFSLSALQKACSAKFGWSADDTLKVAQSLYETHKVTTYPRSDCTYLPEEQIPEVPEILAHLARQPDLQAAARVVGATPQVRKSVFNSSKVTAHHAIVPNTSPATLDALSHDERRAYLLIARHYMAALAPDHVFDETRIAMNANGVLFTAVGRVSVTEGWKAIFSGDAAEDEEERPRLPSIPDGTEGTVQRVIVEGKKTQPPKPYTEGTLIGDMEAVAKFATDPAVRARLKETSGIGTEATRAGIIKTNRDRRFLRTEGRYLRSTEQGRRLYDALPSTLTDPALTAVWEDHLETLASGTVPVAMRDRFVAIVAAQLPALIEGVVAQGAVLAGDTGGGGSGPPSAKMLALATAIAEQMGVSRLPAEVKADFAACRAYIDKHKPTIDAQRAGGRPSDKQIEWARQLANHHGIVLPDEVESNRQACSLFIEQHQIHGRRKSA
jgi:DNA topoisomerase III